MTLILRYVYQVSGVESRVDSERGKCITLCFHYKCLAGKYYYSKCIDIRALQQISNAYLVNHHDCEWQLSNNITF